MKNILLLLILIILSSFYWVNELPTFGRLFRNHDIIYSVQETIDGGFILGSDKGILKTNAAGLIEWQKFIVNYHHRIEVVQNPDGSYAALFVELSEGLEHLQINTYDASGSFLSNKLLISSVYIYQYSIHKTKDGGNALLVQESDSINYTQIIRYNDLFDIEWQANFETSLSFITRPRFTQTADSGFLAIGARGKLTRFNARGDTLWTNFTLPRAFNLVSELRNGNIILAGANKTGLLSSEGAVIKENVLAMISPKSMATDRNNDFIYIAGEDAISLIKLDYELNEIWMDSTDNKEHAFKDIITTQDEKIVTTGFFKLLPYYKGFLLKTETNGYYEYLFLGYPYDGQMLQISDILTIRWATTLSGNINLKYSVDNGTIWYEIISDYPADSLQYLWTTPGLAADQFIIRIESSVNPQFYDEHNTPLVLIRKDYDFIATNQVLMWFANNGDGSHDPFTDGNGFYWPGGLHATQSAIFEDGLLWGGYVGDSIRVNGNTHRQGIQPGNILEDGKAGDPADPKYGIWRAKPDWQSLPDGGEKDRLEYDWNNWPVDLGAPWIDNNFDDIYDPQIDQPKITGDETFWMVMNDMDTSVTRFTYGSDPIGLEIKLQVYAYDQENDLADVVFKKYQVYNKGQNSVDSMFFTYWSDPDLGGAGDDFVGCDTLLNLAYCYNDGDDDAIYEAPVPAVGYLLLQGPKVAASANEQAFFYDHWTNGFTNASMYAFNLFIGGSQHYSDPNQGVIEGSYQFYNYFNGFFWNGEPIIEPQTDKVTKYALTGDPVNSVGWYEGQGWPGGASSGDRRMVMSTGPFDFAPGDSQEVVYAIIIARGENYLDSVTELKRKAAAVREFYYTGVLPTAIEVEKIARTPERFQLHQNYPNPFNPTTIINYELRITNDVKLVIYDVLGREIKTLVNKKQSPGKYEVTFHASGLASGVYYYKLVVGDKFEKTSKMLLLK